jgi:hypothetical protein
VDHRRIMHPSETKLNVFLILSAVWKIITWLHVHIQVISLGFNQKLGSDVTQYNILLQRESQATTLRLTTTQLVILYILTVAEMVLKLFMGYPLENFGDILYSIVA